MRRALLTTLCIGVGWILGVTVMMVLMPITGSSAFNMSFTEAIGNTFVFGFPGFILFMIAIILAIRDGPENDAQFSGDF